MFLIMVQSDKRSQNMRKNCRNILKSNLNRISRERLKSKEQKRALEKIKLLSESRHNVIKLFNDYSSIASEA